MIRAAAWCRDSAEIEQRHDASIEEVAHLSQFGFAEFGFGSGIRRLLGLRGGLGSSCDVVGFHAVD
jgi:hypothetical protein